MATFSPVTEKAFPHNLDAERALLGSILLDNSVLNLAVEALTRDDFFSDAHRIIFQKMIEISEKTRTVDLVTLSEEMGREGALEKSGGAAYIASLSDGVPMGAPAAVAEYLRIIKEKSTVRRLINASTNIITRSLEGADDAITLVDLAQSQIFEIAQEKVRSGFMGVQDIVRTSFGRIENLLERGQRITGVETGFRDLDELTSGLQPGELIIIAARPSLGKTALALNISVHASAQRNKAVGFFSLEMSKESLVLRVICSEAEIDSHKLRGGFLSRDEDWPKITHALGRLIEAPLYIEDTPALTIMQIRAKARRLKAEKGLDLMMVDYLQLVTGHTRFENRTQEVSFISRGLKSIAKELNIPVVALSQLSRAPEQRGGPPKLSDLRESGSIEQDADVVIFIDRERHAEDADEEGGEPLAPRTKLIIGKQRNGPTGEIPIVFHKPYVRFYPEIHGSSDQ